MYKDKFRKKSTFFIDAFDLEEIIHEQYAEEFEIILNQQNDSVIAITVNGNFDADRESALQLYINCKKQDYNTIYLVMNDMCRRDLIEPGEYLISISW